MSLIDSDGNECSAPPSRDYRLSVSQLSRLGRAGALRPDRAFELIEGKLVRRMTIDPPHSYTVVQAATLLRELLPAHLLVREEKPIYLDPQWLPQPDIAVVVGPNRRYRQMTPTISDIVLLIEVADTTYPTDRGVKWRRYASAGIPHYWIANLGKNRIEVYRRPAGSGVDASYQSAEMFEIGSAVPVHVADREIGRVAVIDMLAGGELEDS